MNFVLDNSVAMCWFLESENDTDQAYAVGVLDSLKVSQALVPSLWALEAANVIARSESKGHVSEAVAQAFVARLSRLNIVDDKETAAHALGETLNLTRRYKLSSYDASYLELALRSGIPIATLDHDLIKAAKKAGVPIFNASEKGEKMESINASQATLSANDICLRLSINRQEFESIRVRAPSPFNVGGDFPARVMSGGRSPTDVEIERLNLTLFPEPISKTENNPHWLAADVDVWRAENKGKFQFGE